MATKKEEILAWKEASQARRRLESFAETCKTKEGRIWYEDESQKNPESVQIALAALRKYKATAAPGAELLPFAQWLIGKLNPEAKVDIELPDHASDPAQPPANDHPHRRREDHAAIYLEVDRLIGILCSAGDKSERRAAENTLISMVQGDDSTPDLVNRICAEYVGRFSRGLLHSRYRLLENALGGEEALIAAERRVRGWNHFSDVAARAGTEVLRQITPDIDLSIFGVSEKDPVRPPASKAVSSEPIDVEARKLALKRAILELGQQDKRVAAFETLQHMSETGQHAAENAEIARTIMAKALLRDKAPYVPEAIAVIGGQQKLFDSMQAIVDGVKDDANRLLYRTKFTQLQQSADMRRRPQNAGVSNVHVNGKGVPSAVPTAHVDTGPMAMHILSRSSVDHTSPFSTHPLPGSHTPP